MKLLTEKFKSSIPVEAYQLGEKLVRQGVVTPVLTSVEEFSVEVDDGEFVETRLFLKTRRLYFTCSCSKSGVCEHVAAALILAERFEDLGFALKKSVAAKLLPAVDSSEKVEELIYEPISKKKPKRKVVESEENFYESSEPKLKAEPTFEGFPEQKLSVSAEIVDLTKRLGDSQVLNQPVDYVINLEESKIKDRLVVQAFYKENGKRLPLTPENSTLDSAVLELIRKSWRKPRRLAKHKIDTLNNVFYLKPATAHVFLKKLAGTNRLFARFSVKEKQIFPLKSGQLWDFSLNFNSFADGFRVLGDFVCDNQRFDLRNCYLISKGKFFITGQSIEWLNDFDCYDLINRLLNEQSLAIETWALDDWLKKLLLESSYPVNRLPEFLHWNVKSSTKPVPSLHIRTAKYKYRGKEQLHADLSFSYNGSYVREVAKDQKVVSQNQRLLYNRDFQSENEFSAVLDKLEFRFNSSNGREEYGWKLPPSKLEDVVKELVMRDWIVTAEGKSYRKPQEMNAKITASGMDWFNLEGSVSFGEHDLAIPELLKALKKGYEFVRLGDGSFGMLPIEWLKNFTPLLEIGLEEDEMIRIRRSQMIILDKLLESIPQLSVDESVKRAVEELESLDVLEPVYPPATFRGTLREYQAEALGWMLFLQKSGFGGILADDMGLGKTVQILSLLEMRRTESHKPSIVVAPKSLLFNWKAEAAKFTPEMRVLIHSGYSRDKSAQTFSQYDLILTTYGTLTRDVASFDFEFDYCILDESQAIKNADTETAKAMRVVKSNHRICMSGTPIENSVSELFSQFEFLNPGILSQSSSLAMAVKSGKLEPYQIEKIRRALLPFILRRTKEEVAKELPPKTEQVIFCEMEGRQQEIYDELKEYYKAKLLGASDEAGGSMEMLSALLRLRQTACHPALVNKDYINAQSVKLEILLEKIAVLNMENHKVLVFSQFKSFLYIIRKRLEEMGFRYSYIDGSVKDRQAEVNKFQNDEQVKTFLISLKAGGTGLNLTKAEYVFILDPWWNPAAEMQAVDRAYRIGQQNPVFAYRMICKNSVEEKVMQMQAKKREVANAVINKETLKTSELTKEDLQFLLN